MRPRLAAAAMTIAALCAGVPEQASAQTATEAHEEAQADQVEQRPAIAAFEGRTIDLGAGWEGATACLVWRERGVLECYRTIGEARGRATLLEAEARAAAARASVGARTTGASAASVAFSSWCGGPLELYRNSWWGGQWIMFFDRGYWQNLGDYGFDDATSSYAVGPCYVHLAEHPWGGGYWYPGDTSPYAAQGWMYWWWDNRVSSIFIE